MASSDSKATSMRGRHTAIALHCSGADAREWRLLEQALDGFCNVLAPEHYGCERVGPWPGDRAFAIDDEAARALAMLDAIDGKVHLVGHSYGGGVALHIALQRPNRVASLTLYEPSAFHLLPFFGDEGRAAHAEIARVAANAAARIGKGDCRGGVSGFVDYWNGAGTWDAMSPRIQAALTRWAPKIPLDFRALMLAAARPADYTTLTCPALLLRGEHAPAPTRILAERLAQMLPLGRLRTVEGCGHMGPVTHAERVMPLMAAHIETAARLAPRPIPTQSNKEGADDHAL
jgi:pimeloyl-ACP methyl ester carboxylesterase